VTGLTEEQYTYLQGTKT